MRAVLLAAFVVLAFGAWLAYADDVRSEPVTFYRQRPGCATATAFSLPSSWETPFKPGMTVWVCR
jgi:hypothetical protein